MFKRIALFIATNLAVLALFSIIASVFGIGSMVSGGQLQLGNLLFIAAFFGFAGSFISLFMSKAIAKWTMGLQVINPNSMNANEASIYHTVSQLAQKAGIAIPEVAVYDSPEPNAFATGPSKNNSLVAVSTGLLNNMNKEQVDAVLAHEIAHVANGDMVTMTLIQGVVNTFVIFFARIAAFAVSKAMASDDDEGENAFSSITFMVTSLIFELIFGLFASIIVAKFSQYREFKADEMGGNLTSRKSMASALQRLLDYTSRGNASHMPENLKAFGISCGPKEGFSLAKLFSTHPPLEERIARLMK